MLIRDAIAADLGAIVQIYNATIAGRMVTADTDPITVESRIPWFQVHTPETYPLWVAEQNDHILGWLSFQAFYGRPAYRATAEVSLYVATDYRRQGIGRQLLQRAIAHSPQLGITTLLGFIFAHNQPSLSLFKSFGFQQWGYLPNVACLDAVERSLIILGYRIGSDSDQILEK